MRDDTEKEDLITLQTVLSQQEKEITGLREELKSREEKIASIEEDLLLASNWIESGDAKLRQILSSYSWRAVQILRKSPLADPFRAALIWRRQGMKGVLRSLQARFLRGKTQRGTPSEPKLYSADEWYLQKNLKKSQRSRLDILLFASIDWDFRYQRPQQLASGFAKRGHRVFYFATTFADSNEYSARWIGVNIYEISLPINKKGCLYKTRLTVKYLADFRLAINALLADYAIKDAIALVAFPTWFPVVEHLKSTHGIPLFADVMDENPEFANMHPDIAEFERQMIAEAEFCFCSAQRLVELVKQKTEKVKLVPNAADFEHFSRLQSNDLLRHIKKPILGYYGAIAEWFDTETIRYLAINRPDWSIVLIGRTWGSDVESLEALNNVHLIGEKPYTDLPKYLYWFDVCLIPFKITNLIRSCNPVKFYEYISSGKPVVSTRLPELERFRELFYLADTPEAFLNQVANALLERDDLRAKARIEAAERNDWRQRVDELVLSIRGTFPKVSIVIVTRNNLSSTRTCLEGILNKTAYPNYEIIAIDNGSSDGTFEFLVQLAEREQCMKSLSNSAGSGFAGATRIGFDAATGEYVVFLSSNALVTRGWLGGLLGHFQDPKVGLVKPMIDLAASVTAANFKHFGMDWLEAYADEFTRMHGREVFDVGANGTACVAIRKVALSNGSMQKENSGENWLEEFGLFQQIKNSNLRVIGVGNVFVHVPPGMSLSTQND